MNIPADRSIESGTSDTTPAQAAGPAADNVIVVDEAAEEPTVRFADFNLAEPISRAITEIGYEKPTPIQAKAIPVVMQGHDVMGAAQTGTGKTAGFALPILQRLMRHANTSASPARHPVRALILAPTRELADQIYENVAAYAKHSGLRSAAVFGGVDIKPQIASLRQGCEVLIATPGRLLDHVEQKTANLGMVEVLVLDEADRMLDMGFLPDIQRIIRLLPTQRQNLMFSATFSKDIRRLAETFLNNPQLIEVARRNATAENVEQLVYKVRDTDAKRAAVAKIVRERDLAQVIVFTNTKIGASRLARLLEQDGLNASAIHGDKSQQERLATLDAFKKNEVRILVATDVAARGLDIAELPAVINYDLPYSAEDYVHRIGRTGRAGASGLALSLMVQDEEKLRVEIEKLIKRKLTPVDLVIEGEATRPRRAEGSERSSSGERGRGGRSRSSSNSSSADRPARGRGRSAPVGNLPGNSRDPFFYQPYTAPAASAEKSAAETADQQRTGFGSRSHAERKARKGPVAALLGGLKQAS